MITDYQAKDFIQTSEGLVFAVVEQGLENGKVLCFLRYRLQGDIWKKLGTQEANQLLTECYPQYLFYSQAKSAHLHAVSVQAIITHHQPRQCLQKILSKQNLDVIEKDLIHLCQLLLTQGIQLKDIGVTGSLLIGAQKASSDLDIVIYNRSKFHKVRQGIKELILTDKLQNLDESAWVDSYKRRLCDLDYADYVWHERRKFNKALVNKRKFDLNLVGQPAEKSTVSYQKKGMIVLRTQVVDARYAFDYPAKLLVADETVAEVICYTATYTGQAEQGETIEVAGQLEISSTGRVRILVGSTREAKGEYIKVMPVS